MGLEIILMLWNDILVLLYPLTHYKINAHQTSTSGTGTTVHSSNISYKRFRCPICDKAMIGLALHTTLIICNTP